MSAPERATQQGSQPEQPRPGWRARVDDARARVDAWLDRRRANSVSMDLVCTYVERDRELLTSILGSAIALRLFLFMVPTVAMTVGMIRLIAGSTTSWVVGAIGFTGAWFAVTWSLPKGTPDPGAALPGAALVGLSFTVLQWFMQCYLPSRLERSSAVAGGVGTAVAVLGSMFILGRVMASSFVLNSLIYERLGSISAPLFELPFLRRLPARFPALVRWFDLPTHDVPTHDE